MNNRVFLLLFSCLLAAASCGKGQDEACYRIVLSSPSGTWHQEAARALEREIYVHREVDLTVQYARSLEDQIDYLQGLKPDAVDLVIVSPFLDVELTPSVERLFDRDGQRGAEFSLRYNFRWGEDAPEAAEAGPALGVVNIPAVLEAPEPELPEGGGGA